MYTYDIEKYGSRYWLDPEYPVEREVFAPTPKGLHAFIRRKNPFVLFDAKTVEYCLSKGVPPLRSIGIGGTHSYHGHDSVTLYLARCRLKAREFYKIGLSTLPNPRSRNSKVYLEIARTHRIPAGESLLPYLYERYTLWKCTEHEYVTQNVFDPVIFKGFAGKTEVIHSSDSHVIYIFDQAFAQLSDYLEKHPEDLAWLEVALLKQLVKAVYDERYVKARASLNMHCSGADFCNVLGTRPSAVINRFSVGMPPADVRLLEKYVFSRLVPLIEGTWEALDIKDPVKRFERGKRNYQAWWGKRGGRTDYWKPRYYDWST